MSVELARAAKTAASECIGRLTEDGPPLIDRGGVGRGVRVRVGALAVTPLQQTRRRFPHLHEPKDQGHHDDDAAELADPRPRSLRRVVYRTRTAVTNGSWPSGAVKMSSVSP
jgi:hypothetical protein